MGTSDIEGQGYPALGLQDPGMVQSLGLNALPSRTLRGSGRAPCIYVGPGSVGGSVRRSPERRRCPSIWATSQTPLRRQRSAAYVAGGRIRRRFRRSSPEP